MSDWPVGLSTGCFYQKSIFDCLEAICRSGFNRIEICSSPAHLPYDNLPAVRRVAERLEALGMEPYSFHAPFAEDIDITAIDASAREHSIKEVLTAVEAAALLQTRYFVIHPGPEQIESPPGEERLRRLENVAHSLDTIAARCAQHGMMCILENKLGHLLFGNIRDMLWILAAMETVHVGVCLDTGHAHLAGHLQNAVYKLTGYLRLVHASDNHGKHDDHLPPGEGEIDWPRFFSHLHSIGYRGSIMLEIAGRGQVGEVLASARQARRFIQDFAWRSTAHLRRERWP